MTATRLQCPSIVVAGPRMSLAPRAYSSPPWFELGGSARVLLAAVLLSGCLDYGFSGDTKGLGSGADSGASGLQDTDRGIEEYPLVDCDRIDFLFVIDSSASMADEQQNLTNSFAGFMDKIERTMGQGDYHVMVVDSDDVYEPSCQTVCDGGYSEACNGHDCSDWPPAPLGCDGTLGAGVNSPGGADCGLSVGTRYLDDSASDLAGSFACVATVGTWGRGDERMMGAMAEALSTSMNESDGCNAGFLRDDALLVVTLITDEPDEHSDGNTTTWREDLVAAKGGRVESIVMLGLIGDNDQEDGICEPKENYVGAEAAPAIRYLVSSFGSRGVLGSVCESDYSPFFDDAVDALDAACE